MTPNGSHSRYVEFVSSPPEQGGPLRIWDVRRLRELATDLPVTQIRLTDIPDIERVGWYGDPGRHGRLTVREIADHVRRIQGVNPDDPILISAEGFVFDGLHRLARAWLEGRETISAKVFAEDPEPDRVNELPEWMASLVA